VRKAGCAAIGGADILAASTPPEKRSAERGFAHTHSEYKPTIHTALFT
jgi:hypothetical protein